MISFKKKRLRVTFELPAGKFANGSNTLKIAGLRMSVEIKGCNNAGTGSSMSATAKIYGLSQDVMNNLNLIAVHENARPNINISIEADNGDGVFAEVFSGQIFSAFSDYSGAPDVFLSVTCKAALAHQLKPTDPVTFKGASDVSVIMKTIADKMGLSFVDHGVTQQLNNFYAPSTALEQARKCARDANIALFIDGKTMAIAPHGKMRSESVPLISPSTGLIGYPSQTQATIVFKSLYNVGLVVGGGVKIESSLAYCCGTFQVYSVTHNLECEMPNGAWFSSVECIKIGAQSAAK